MDCGALQVFLESDLAMALTIFIAVGAMCLLLKAFD